MKAGKKEIIETAATLIGQFGRKKVNMADVANALSMSPANIYRYFGTKEQ